VICSLVQIYCTFDLVYYSTQVTRLICSYLNICCFKIAPFHSPTSATSAVPTTNSHHPLTLVHGRSLGVHVRDTSQSHNSRSTAGKRSICQQVMCMSQTSRMNTADNKQMQHCHWWHAAYYDTPHIIIYVHNYFSSIGPCLLWLSASGVV